MQRQPLPVWRSAVLSYNQTREPLKRLSCREAKQKYILTTKTRERRLEKRFGGYILERSMSDAKSKIKLFEEKQVRALWDEEAEKWWFSIVDIVAVLTDNDYQTARKYWKVLKGRLAAEGNETVTKCYQLKMKSTDGKMYLTDTADTEQVLRLVQSIPSNYYSLLFEDTPANRTFDSQPQLV
jgi:hypothetical protein